MQSKLNEWLGTSAIIVLAAVWLAGLINSETRELFKALTPFILILNATILLWFHKRYSMAFWIFAIGTYVVSFMAALIGVKTGFPFGEFSYGPNMGVKIIHTPVLIGVYWFMLIYSVGIITAKFPAIKLMKALTGALLLLLIDFALEPVAMTLDLWQWQAGEVPTQNYVAWFGLSFLLLVFFHLSRFRKDNHIAVVLYVTFLLFYTLLNFIPL